MELLIKLLTVFGLGAVELWVAIPAGFAMGLPPSVTAITAVSGAMLGLLFILIVGERIRNRLLKRVKIEHRHNKYIYIICVIVTGLQVLVYCLQSLSGLPLEQLLE